MTHHTATVTTDARTLHDSDTGELIGTATAAQIDASDGAGHTGHILIDTDGDVVTVGTWAAQQPGIRRVWVSAAPTGKTVILPSDVDDPIGYGARWALRVAGVDRDEQQGLADIITDEWWEIYGGLTAEALTVAGYEVVRTGPIGSPDCIDAERRHADDLHDGDGLPVDMGHVNHLAEVRFARWWQDNAEALCDQHASECDVETAP